MIKVMLSNIYSQQTATFEAIIFWLNM